MLGYHNCNIELASILVKNTKDLQNKLKESSFDKDNLQKMINELKNIR